MPGLGNAITLAFTSGGFISEYQTVWDLFITKPSALVADADNTMVKTLVDAGLWGTKLDVFDHLAQETNGGGEALKNWISPGTFDPTIVNAPPFVSLEGFTGDGATAYINMNWKPSSDGVNYLQDDASYACYQRNNAQDEWIMGVAEGSVGFCILKTRAGDDDLKEYINALVLGSVDCGSDSRGMSIITRTASNVDKGYRNKSNCLTDNNASTGVPDVDFYALAFNSDGSPSNFSSPQLSLLFAGASLSQADVNIITDAFETRMDTLGKGVIT
ncbi:hypothetical protein KA005_13300 [bacterium]|nr:hypothetical protein [bacterium]